MYSKVVDEDKSMVEKLAEEFYAFSDTRVYRPISTMFSFYKKIQLLLTILHSNPKIEIYSQLKRNRIADIRYFL